MSQFHFFHIISPRPWPLIVGIFAINSLASVIFIIINHNNFILLLNTLLLIITVTRWWKDISKERSFQGYHSTQVISGLRAGILLFIISEILFFASFFWIFFHRRLAPTIEIGNIWPPLGIQAINPFQIPLLNTVILLSSGITVTWAHHSIIKNKIKITHNRLLLTIILGAYFTILQGWEYWDASFTFSDSIFGSSFFIATGFHGLHVIIGTIFLWVSFERFKSGLLSQTHHLGFEISIWYWHFVDVVWLFLYSFLYWWSYFVISILSIFNFQLKGFNQNNKILSIFYFLILLCIIIYLLSSKIKIKKLKQREKRSPFECGFDPNHKLRNSFSLRFFLITILFLIFDLETAIILPLPLNSSSLNPVLLISVRFFICVILILGIFFEWTQGALSWK